MGSYDTNAIGVGRAKVPLKWVLSGSTALVGAGALADTATAAEAEGIQLDLSGFLISYYGIGGVDEADGETSDFNAVSTFFDGEVHIGGTATFDNGLKVGLATEIELPGSADSQTLDETYLFLDSKYGELRFGGDNTAAYRAALGTFGASGVGVQINSGWISNFIPAVDGFQVAFRSPSVSTAIDITNDDNVITYFTPRKAGFQFGASYVPNPSNSGVPTNGPVDLNGFDYNNGFAFGGNYVGETDKFSYGVSLGYAQAHAGDEIEDVGGDDIQQFLVGVTGSMAGFTLNASYATEFEGRTFEDDGVISTTEGDSYAIGLQYDLDKWSYSVGYIHGEVDGDVDVGGDDELDAAVVSARYGIAPGLDIGASVLWADWDDEANGSQDGTVFAAGLNVSF